VVTTSDRVGIARYLRQDTAYEEVIVRVIERGVFFHHLRDLVRREIRTNLDVETEFSENFSELS